MIRLVTLFALCAIPATANQLRLDFPVDCEIGNSCYIQNFVDRDPSPKHRDFGCGGLSYDGHRGTDIALLDTIAMEQGVDVYAAAPGTVKAKRDGMQDILFNAPNAPDITNRACGNAVILQHDDGWETRYCHMKQGSIAVRTGDIVAPGTVLGQVGLSGKTEFPHLHISVHQHNKVIDPFQPQNASTCGTTTNSLWADAINYTPGGLLSMGFSDGIPEFSDIKSGTAAAKMLFRRSGAIVLWAHMFGSRIGDELHLEIRNRQGLILQKTVTLTRAQARLFRAVGKKRPPSGWRPGTYHGEVKLIRNGQILGTQTADITVNP